jgi:cobalamin biosynthesis Mg chelatase CobN
MKLEAGKYVFRIADTASRNVIQVLSEDEGKILGQWLFVSAERPEVTADTVVTFRETNAAATPAVQFWYYPGEKVGKEFIYPRDQAQRIAARTGATVKTEEGPVTATASATAAPPAAATPRPQPPPEQRTARADVAPAPAPAPQERAAAEPTARPRESVRLESTVAQNEPVERTELPSTASPLPLLGLIGVLSLVGAAGLRFFRA